MFTGLVEDIGVVKAMQSLSGQYENYGSIRQDSGGCQAWRQYSSQWCLFNGDTFYRSAAYNGCYA